MPTAVVRFVKVWPETRKCLVFSVQFNLIYITSVTINIVSRCFMDTQSLTSVQATVKKKNSFITGRNLQQDQIFRNADGCPGNGGKRKGNRIGNAQKKCKFNHQ